MKRRFREDLDASRFRLYLFRPSSPARASLHPALSATRPWPPTPPRARQRTPHHGGHRFRAPCVDASRSLRAVERQEDDKSGEGSVSRWFHTRGVQRAQDPRRGRRDRPQVPASARPVLRKQLPNISPAHQVWAVGWVTETFAFHARATATPRTIETPGTRRNLKKL